METMSRWTAGDRVLVRASRCVIAAVERFTGCEALTLAPCAPPEVAFGTLLAPFDRPRRLDATRRLKAVRPRRWLHRVRELAARHHAFGSLRAAAAANMEVLPYQLEPALAMRRDAWLRVLIADAVGLGKTIEAGLVLAELVHGASSRRALVVVPAGLRQQWHAELSVRFRIDAAVCDAAWLRQRSRDLPADSNPWSLPGTYIVSLDFLKQPEVLRPIEDLLWDITIVDEAHQVTLGTDRRAAVDAVASRARRVLLLTATPHSGDDAQFDALCALGQGPDCTPLLIFQRRRDAAARRLVRRGLLLRVRLSADERRMHELLDRYTSRLWRESLARRDGMARLVPIVLRKRALSSAGSLAASLARRLDLLAMAEGQTGRQLALPIFDRSEDEIEDDLADGVLGAPGLANAALERRWLAALLEVSRRAAADEGKLACLRRYLARINEPAIVFTEYRDTLARIQRALARLPLPVLTLHGGMPEVERRAVLRQFNDHDALLLATDAAAEGLNLQQRCRVVVHFELPWNPLRLEQRAGRVDRIGQARRVHEIALVADETAERVVLAPLARRARKAREAGGADSRLLERLSEMRIARAVLEGDPDAIPCSPDPTTHAEPQVSQHAIGEAARIEAQRRWRAAARPRSDADEHGTVVTTLTGRGRRRGCRLTLVHSLSLETGDGSRAHGEVLVISLSLADGSPSVRSAAAAVEEARRVLSGTQAAIDSAIARRLEVVRAQVVPRHDTAVRALRTREAAIAQLGDSAARELVQAGLFDRRTLRLAEIEQAADLRRREEAANHLRELSSAEMLRTRVTLEAVLLHDGDLT